MTAAALVFVVDTEEAFLYIAPISVRRQRLRLRLRGGFSLLP